MAGSPNISGFSADTVRAGLRLAMQVGLPVAQGDQPTFYMPISDVTPTEAVDSEGVPFDPNYRPAKTSRVTLQVPCAIEYKDSEGTLENFGAIVPARVTLTLLDQDYLKVKGFEFVVIGGNRYNYRRTEAPLGLVTVGVYTVHCTSDDEG
jgi:hypothetical protein